jgi:molecular chaperone DnaJ
MNAQPGSRDLYEVLGVPRAASPADLKKAYRNLAQRFHPDKCPGDKSAEEKFKEAANAYQILSDTDKRSAYDRYGLDGLRRGGVPGGPEGPAGAPYEGFRNVEDIFSAFGDLFGDFFAGHARRPARGADLRLNLTISFGEAVWGVRKDVKLARTAACGSCGGSGAMRGSKAEGCRNCQGKGQVTHAQGFFMVQSTCAQCQGRGRTIQTPCSDCRGQGMRPETSTISVAVPAGIDDGQTLRVHGKGEAASNGGAGDLYVVVNVEDDDRFMREGSDITTEISISYAQAALGGEIEIDTLDDGCRGTTILELSPGTQPDDLVVRRGQGIPNVGGHGRGDHLIQFKIEVPKKLTAKQEKLLREFAAELGEESKRHKKKRSK